MKVSFLVTVFGIVAAAQQTVLWVPECGDEVLMLGTHVAGDFKKLNTLSVTDIDSILAFQTYTVVLETSVPPGFKYDGGYLVKDPPRQHTITTCAAPFAGPEAAHRTTPADVSLTKLQSTAIQPTELKSTEFPSLSSANATKSSTSTAERATSCYTTGRPVTNSASVLNIVFDFCGSHLGVQTPTKISSTKTQSADRMLIEINPVQCYTIASETKDMPIRFGSPDSSSPTGSAHVYAALWPCVKMVEIWEYCKCIWYLQLVSRFNRPQAISSSKMRGEEVSPQ